MLQGFEKDLGVIVQNNLSPEKHINKIFGKTYNMFQNIGFLFHYLYEGMMKKILSTRVGPQLKYAAVIWSSHIKKICEEDGKGAEVGNKDDTRV